MDFVENDVNQEKWALMNQEVNLELVNYNTSTDEEIKMKFEELTKEISTVWTNDAKESEDGSMTLHFENDEETDKYMKKLMLCHKLGQIVLDKKNNKEK